MKSIIIFLAVFLSGQVAAQTSLGGKITDEETGEALLFANIAVYKNGNLVTGTQTDFDGFYNITNIDPGTYDVEASYSGYASHRLTGVIIYGGQANNVDIALSQGVSLQEVSVIAYKIPRIKQDETTSGGTLTSEQLRRLSAQNIKSNKKRRKRRKKERKKKRQLKENAVTILRKSMTNSEEYGKFIENDFITVARENTSTFSIDVDRASYSMARRFLTQNHRLPPPDAVRIEEMINYFDYDYEQPKGKAPFSIYSATAQCPWNPENILLHVGIQGREMELNDAAPNNLVFLIDVSGSMSSAGKLELLKPAFKLLVEKLRPEDRVAIVVYAGNAGLVLPSTSAADKKTIIDSLEKLQAGGSTAGGAGINLAYKTARENFVKNGNNRVILATDGDFNVGVSDPGGLENMIVRKRKEGIYLTTLGFGMGNYKDNRMEILADKGNGNYAYIDNLKEAEKVFISELTGTLYTIAKDVKIQIEFDDEFVDNYRLIGYENRLLKKEDFHDDTKDAGELGAGHTVTALYELKLKQFSPEEILKLKLRYKFPKHRQSRYIETFTTGDALPFESASENLRFAASVAGFGMLLRQSKYAGDMTYEKAEKMAAGAIGKDQNGYRKEFLELVKAAKEIEAIASK